MSEVPDPLHRAPQPQPHGGRHERAAFVVGLGASAGGIQALQQFFAHVPERTGATYVVILHLSPDHESRLAEVLQGTTSLPVTKVGDRAPVEPDHVYVIPQDRSLSIADGHFIVSEVTRLEQRRAPVDIFFRALADAYAGLAASVILSGTGSDGSSGLKRVKEHGGLTIAQDPNEAGHDDMPRHAIATGFVDYVLPVAQMPGRIVDYFHRLPGAGRGDADPHEPIASEADSLRDIFALLRSRTGHDFSNYKRATVLRRIARRMTVLGEPTLADYARALRDHPDEATALIRELLISVTNFFRDPVAFSTLQQRVVPRLFEGKRSGDQVRAWVPACATGEEAYSVAMLLVEHASTLMNPPTVQVFATDLDQHAIATAREGLYSEADIADVTEDRLRRFFQRETAGYRVRRELRELVLFAQHNIIKDPPFSHLDLVSCRNLLIYLDRSAQDRVLETLHFALRPGAFLFLGTSETANRGTLFVPLDKNAHIFESRTGISRPPPPRADAQLPPAVTLAGGPLPPRAPTGTSPGELHQRLLEQYAPPSLVVTEDHVIVHLSERAGRYLEVPGGEPSRDLLKLIHRDLRADLRAALHQALLLRTTVEVHGVRSPSPADQGDLSIVVKPALREGTPARGFFLVLFDNQAHSRRAEHAGFAATLQPDGVAGELEDELTRVRAQLHATIEQYETQVEEAKAANEELQALNEELRSSAEELETSKEELQSVNEELTTVNQELKVKIDELALTNNDFRNFINATDIGTVFLDRSSRVKLATRRAQDIFNLLPTDTGRRLSDITTTLKYDRLYEDVAQVLDRLQTLEREVEARDGRWFLMRVLPYRTEDDRIDGVVLTFLDITERRQVETRLKIGEERLRLLIDSAVDYAIFTMTSEGLVDSWNPGAQRMFRYTADEIIGSPSSLLFTPEDRAAGIPEEELRRAARDGRADDERYHLRSDGSRFYCSGVTTRLGDNATLGFAKIARDLTMQRQAEERLVLAQASLEDQVQRRTGELRGEIARRAAAQEHAMDLLRKLVTAQEDQRARIARDLHDQLGQQLTALRLALERYQGRNPQDGQPDEDLQRALALTRELDAEVDFLAWELRPAVLDDIGLVAALPRFVEEWSNHYGIPAECRTIGFKMGDLSRESEVTFYRIAQEALTNVVKHAHASRVDVILETRDGTVLLVIEDNGVGFDTATQEPADGIGLAGMRERAALSGADLEIESSPGEGTTVFLRTASIQHTAAEHAP